MAQSEPGDIDYDELKSLSLEELLSTDVTSVAGRAEPWFRTPAAMYVITGEDVRRSGHLHIAEALRLAPGMTVLRNDANSWQIGARGFNGGLANKQLVLIDGRTTYDLLFSGTFWDVQDVMLEDLARIEVIRGPGATLWGANAVNGVINITTKSAKDTQGFYFRNGVGTEDHFFSDMRYGFQIDDSSWMRVWGKYKMINESYIPGSGGEFDDWDSAHGGFRYDREGPDGGFLTVIGDVYDNSLGEATTLSPSGFNNSRASGGSMLVRMGREEGDQGWTLQGYYDRTERATSSIDFSRDTFDLDFRNHFNWGEAQELVWGMAARHSVDESELLNTPIFSFGYDPTSRSTTTWSTFVQNTTTLVEDRWYFMMGSKFEYNDFTGFEIQPNARLWWTPDDNQTLWFSVSRPVRTPSRTEDDLFIAYSVPGPLPFDGNTDVESEELIAYETGYRRRITEDLTMDVAVFFNDYDNLVSTNIVPSTLPGPSPVMTTFQNHGAAHAYGVEVAGMWRVADNWRLNGSYSFFDAQTQDPSTLDAPEGGSPRNMAQLRSELDITKDLELNAALYYFDNIPNTGVHHHLRLDVGMTWHINDQLDFSIWGQNLLDPSHREGSSAYETQRAGYLMFTYRF